MAHAGRLLSRGEIFDALWAPHGGATENVVDVYLGYLRRKLDNFSPYGLALRTLRGRGFVLDLGGYGMKLPCCLRLILPLPAAAGALSDLLMAPGSVRGRPAPGRCSAYARRGPCRRAPGSRRLTDGRLLLALAEGPEGRSLALTQDVEGTERPVASFSAGAANPVLLYFLESTVARHGAGDRRQPVLHPQPDARGAGGGRPRAGGRPARGGDRTRSRPTATAGGWAPSPISRCACASTRTAGRGFWNFRRIPPRAPGAIIIG